MLRHEVEHPGAALPRIILLPLGAYATIAEKFFAPKDAKEKKTKGKSVVKPVFQDS